MSLCQKITSAVFKKDQIVIQALINKLRECAYVNVMQHEFQQQWT